MSPTKNQRDVGLTIHRILQWVASIGVTVVGAIVISGMGTWGELKEQAIRMENVPSAVESIRNTVDELATASAVEVQVNRQQDRRLDALEIRRR